MSVKFKIALIVVSRTDSIKNRIGALKNKKLLK